MSLSIFFPLMEVCSSLSSLSKALCSGKGKPWLLEDVGDCHTFQYLSVQVPDGS